MGQKYKLVYFDSEGRAEIVRWIFAYAGVDYEDKRINREAWPGVKPTTPLGQLPFLEVDGESLPQSLAIARFVARTNGLAGKDDWEAAQVDALVDYIQDAVKGMMPVRQEKDESKKAALKKTFVEDFLPPYLQKLERKLGKNDEGKGFFVGSNPTWGDFFVVIMLDRVAGFDSAVLDKYPNLKAHNQRVHELKGVKEWIAKQPRTQN